MNSEIIISPVGKLGQMALHYLRELGSIAIFFIRGFFLIFSFPPPHFSDCSTGSVYRYKIDFRYLSDRCVYGMVLGFQGYYSLVMFGSEGFLGSAVSLSLIRELGPVLTAIMVTGRAGSAMAAEIGIMRISEQIDALKQWTSIRFVF